MMKISFLAFVILLCTISVSFATEDATDIADTVSTPTIEQQTVDTAKELQTTSNENNQKDNNKDNKNVRTTNSNDTYTFTNTTLDITGNSYDGHELTILDNVNVTSSNHMQLSNTVFKIIGNNVNISGLTFKNFDNSPIVFTVIGSNVNITNNFINLTNVQALETKGVSIKNSSNVRVSNNTIYLAGVPQAAGWTNETGEWVENMKVSGIKAETSTGITINNNILTITATETGETASSTDAITIKTCNDSQVENNTITIDGSDYIYGISATTFNNNIRVFNNTVYLTGKNYICGVQFSSTSNSRAKLNRVYGNCTATSGACPSFEAFAYGVIDLTGTWGASTSEAVGNIIEDNYVELDSTIAYAYELSNTDQTQVLNNNATITGNVVMGLGIYNSTNSNITGNKFNITGNTRTLNSSIYEAVPPETTGIKLVGDTTNIRITGNTITVKDSNLSTVYSIILECSGNRVINNALTSINSTNVETTGINSIHNLGNNIIFNNH